ncbi:MAG: 4-(cytidine 5'-diphospho)-2-C-methyl-D-erythritol kinase [Verrucomicrobiota bacterium]
MPTSISILAPAKTNLSLEVVGKRTDGFHDIRTLMVRLSLADRLDFKKLAHGLTKLTCSDPKLEVDGNNLIIKAIRILEQELNESFPVSVHLEKQIPVAAGLGGGSSDAAATLLGLNQLFELDLSTEMLASFAASIGSDVPFFVYQQSCLCTGRGEIVTPTEKIPTLPILLVKPGFGISAAWAYQHYQSSIEHDAYHYSTQVVNDLKIVNDLERPVFQKFPVLGSMKTWLLDQPEIRTALLSGSGSTVFAILEQSDNINAFEEKVVERFGPSTWTWSGHTL